MQISFLRRWTKTGKQLQDILNYGPRGMIGGNLRIQFNAIKSMFSALKLPGWKWINVFPFSALSEKKPRLKA